MSVCGDARYLIASPALHRRATAYALSAPAEFALASHLPSCTLPSASPVGGRQCHQRLHRTEAEKDLLRSAPLPEPSTQIASESLARHLIWSVSGEFRGGGSQGCLEIDKQILQKSSHSIPTNV